MTTMREDLADWADWDVAAHSYGNAIGIFEGANRRQVNRVVLSDNPLGLGLHDGVEALVRAGVLERRDQPEEQYRWVFAGTSDLPGATVAAEADARPVALDLPGISGTPEDVLAAQGDAGGTSGTGSDTGSDGSAGRSWWRRGRG